MKPLRIFISSSVELSEERKVVVECIDHKAAKVKRNRIDLKAVMWEKLPAYSTTVSNQTIYEKKMARCEIFICMIHRKVGQYTKRELDIAIQNCQRGRNPRKVLFLFKRILSEEMSPDTHQVIELMERLKKQERFPVWFSNSKELTDLIEQNIDKALERRISSKPTGSIITTRPFSSLPRRSMGFVNRTQEIEHIKAYLIQRRAVHLHGLGGIGKTDLGTEIAYRCRKYFRDGIIWYKADKCQIEELLNQILSEFKRELVASPLSEKKNLTQRLLLGKRILIVLDNVEIENRMAVQELIDLVPDCAILVTTRSRKGLSFNNVITVELDELALKESVALFESKTGRRFNEVEKNDTVLVYKQLGGIPLALELAARWAESSHSEIIKLAQWLREKGIELLHKENEKIRAIFSYTYNQLDKDEKKLFTIIGAFWGETFTLEAVEKVSKMQTVELILHKFIGLSLLKKHENRYYFHPLLKFYARGKLSDHQVQRRMMKYYLSLTSRFADQHSVLEGERDNILGALDYASTQGDGENELLFIDLLMGGHDAYYGFFAQRGYWNEGIKRAEQAIELTFHLKREMLTARYYSHLGLFHYWLGQQKQARQDFEKAHELLSREKNIKGMIVCLHQLGYIEDDENRYARAREVYTKSLTLAQKIKDQRLIALGYHLVGVIDYHQGFYDKAQQNLQKAIAIDQDLGIPQAVARNQRRLAAVLRMKAHYCKTAQRKDFLKQGFALIEAALQTESSIRSQARGQRQLGMLYEEDKQLEKAKKCYEKSLTIFESIGNKKGVGTVQYNLGSVCEKTKLPEKARKWYLDSKTIAAQVNSKYGQACALRQLGLLAKKQNALKQARSLLTESLEIFESIQSCFKAEVEQLLNQLR